MQDERQELLLRRIQGEYSEMPGLQLTEKQARRLWTLDDRTCRRAFQTLVESRFLVRGPDAMYRLVVDAHSQAPSAHRAAACGGRSR